MIYSFLFFNSRVFQYFLVFLVVIIGCKSSDSTIQKTDGQQVKIPYQFLSLKTAQAKISEDRKEGFFDKIQQLDMVLQMNRSSSEKELVSVQDYKDHLIKGTLEFTEGDKSVLTATLDSCFNMIHRKFPNLELPTIELIKTDGNHYGPSVYYTRENSIIIPANVLDGGSIGTLQAVMFHEISHILLRYNDRYKKESYGLIGFKTLEAPVSYPTQLQSRILLNPDGLDNRFYITLEMNGVNRKVVPIILSSKSSKSENISGFMNYIKFDLYGLEEMEKGFMVSCNEEGMSDLAAGYMQPFFEQIKENTQYIIHPDEIIADNFMMLMIGERDGTIENFNDEGQKLLMDLKKILSN